MDSVMEPFHSVNEGDNANNRYAHVYDEDTNMKTEELNREGSSEADTETMGPTLQYRLKNPDDPIKQLERENRSLIIANQSLTYDFPPTLSQDPAHILATQIHHDITSAYDTILQSIANHPFPHVAVFDASDEASKAMVPYIQQVDQLSKMEGGLDLALSLIRYLGKKSYVSWMWDGKDELEVPAPPVGKEGVKRESDGMADEVYVKLLKMKMEERRKFRPVQEFEELEKERSLFSKKGGARAVSVLKPGYFDSYFPRAWLFMRSLVSNGQSLDELAMAIKRDIDERKPFEDLAKTKNGLKFLKQLERFDYLEERERIRRKGLMDRYCKQDKTDLQVLRGSKKFMVKRKQFLMRIAVKAKNKENTEKAEKGPLQVVDPNISSIRPCTYTTRNKPSKLSKTSKVSKPSEVSKVLNSSISKATAIAKTQTKKH